MPQRNQLRDMLTRARSHLVRLRPRQAWRAMAHGACLVDIRPEFQRRADGEVPGAIVIERNHLEWRLHPSGRAHIPEAARDGVRWIVICDEGYASSLAADTLKTIGLDATDVVGGFQAWRAARLPIDRRVPPTPPRLASNVDGRRRRRP